MSLSRLLFCDYVAIEDWKHGRSNEGRSRFAFGNWKKIHVEMQKITRQLERETLVIQQR